MGTEKHHECVVLYVEDDDATAYLFQQAMQQAGSHVRLFRVSDGEKGIAFLHREGVYHKAPTPDLVILDVNLPKKTGFDVLTTIRQTESLKDIPVVMFSSSTLPDHRERATTLGAVKFFNKTGQWDGFLETAKSICGMIPPRSTRE